jgi:hypothetical protein
MTMEWSHSFEAYDYARDYLCERVGHDELVVIAAEWDVYTKVESDEENDYPTGFDQKFYEERLAFYADYSDESLAMLIWDKMAELRSATNGGHAFWGCPYGCECHLIPVGGEEEFCE